MTHEQLGGPGQGQGEARARVPVPRPPGWSGAALAALLTLGGASPARGAPLPETFITYDIEARLDPASRSLEGTSRITWRNPGERPVERLYLNLYLNAFSHTGTTWMASPVGTRTDFPELPGDEEEPWGYSELVEVRVDGAEAPWVAVAPDDGNPLDRTLIEVPLTQPLGPDEALTLSLAFEARLPFPLARTGGWRDFFVGAQWYPKVAPYEIAGTRGVEVDGWRPHQFHRHTEFYANFADFTVTLEAPRGWLIEGTGLGETLEDGRRRFRQEAVHDFAWVAGSDLDITRAFHDPAGPGGPVELSVVFPDGLEAHGERCLVAMQEALDVMGAQVGAYPYTTLTLALPPQWAGATAGMEYPTFILGMIGDPLLEVPPFAEFDLSEITIYHELAHQYFYGLVASNEQEEALLDEGFTEYWTLRIGEAVAEPGETRWGRVIDRDALLNERMARALHRARTAVATRPAWLSESRSSGVQFYRRPALALLTATRRFGADTIDRVFQVYFEAWAFGHPQLGDFLAAAHEVGVAEIGAFLTEAFYTDEVPNFAVTRAEARPWEPPGAGSSAPGVAVIPVTGEDPEGPSVPPPPVEAAGPVVRVIDPGYVEGTTQVPGAITSLRPPVAWGGAGEEGAQGTPGEPEVYISEVEVSGPGWRHLDTELSFRFEGGAEVRIPWDGRARWRRYELRWDRPLVDARVDPEGLIPLDRDLSDNGLRVEPSEELGAEIRQFLLGLAWWLGGGVGW